MNANARIALITLCALAVHLNGNSGIESAVAGEAKKADDVRQHIEMLERKRYKALVEIDLPFLEQVFDDSLIYSHSRGKVETKAQYLTNLKAKRPRYLAARVEKMNIRVFPENDMCIVHATIEIHLQHENQQEEETKFQSTAVYLEKGGTWRMVAIQNARATHPN